jgi:hypothetical protein
MHEECHLLRPARPTGPGAEAVGIYCALPDGRVRVPETSERKLFCLPGRHELCPVYQRHVPAR